MAIIPNYGNAMVLNEPDILQKISPASRTLSDLDIWERKAKQQFKDRVIGVEKYHETLEAIDCKRTKAIEKLERERGTYISPAMASRKLKAEEKEESDRVAYDNLVWAIREQRALEADRAFWARIRKGFVSVLVVCGVIVGYHSTGIALLCTMGFLCYYFKSK